jgi:sugar/nucleoside kinase (ribokinase family)
MRDWDEEGNVFPGEWPEADYALRHAEAVVISDEDTYGDVDQIVEMAASSKVLVVTHGAEGSSLYMNGEIHHIHTPKVEELDPTGAGDIYAAAFFVSLKGSKTPIEAARFASQVASLSVTRRGLEGAPTKDDIYNLMLEVL